MIDLKLFLHFVIVFFFLLAGILLDLGPVVANRLSRFGFLGCLVGVRI